MDERDFYLESARSAQKRRDERRKETDKALGSLKNEPNVDYWGNELSEDDCAELDAIIVNKMCGFQNETP